MGVNFLYHGSEAFTWGCFKSCDHSEFHLGVNIFGKESLKDWFQVRDSSEDYFNRSFFPSDEMSNAVEKTRNGNFQTQSLISKQNSNQLDFSLRDKKTIDCD